MLGMAGFTDEYGNLLPYDVPRTKIDYPNEWKKLIFPRLELWLAQSKSLFGDAGEAATNVLTEVIPLFCDCVIQDGIYWIIDFPKHEYSMRLLFTIPGYASWAEDQRTNLLPSSNKSNTTNEVEKKEIIIPNICKTPQRGTHQPVQGISKIDRDMSSTTRQLPSNITVSIPVHLCDTIVDIISHWQSNGLDNLRESSSRATWPGPIANRYGKRKYLVDCIFVHANRNNIPVLKAAKDMDNIRCEKGFTCNQYHDYLKNNDVYMCTPRRNKKTKLNV